jgi:hypothetical protein
MFFSAFWTAELEFKVLDRGEASTKEDVQTPLTS